MRYALLISEEARDQLRAPAWFIRLDRFARRGNRRQLRV